MEDYFHAKTVPLNIQVNLHTFSCVTSRIQIALLILYCTDNLDGISSGTKLIINTDRARSFETIYILGKAKKGAS